MLDLTEANVASYFLSVAPKIWGKGTEVAVTKSEEVTEETYVNYIFRVVARIDGRRVVVYLRQSRDHVKTRPERALEADRVVYEARIHKLIGRVVPDLVPNVLYLDKVNNVACLSDIKGRGRLLVKELVVGRVHHETGFYFGRALAEIHSQTLGVDHSLVRGTQAENQKAIDFHLGMRLEPALTWHPKATKRLLADGKGAAKTLVCGDLASKNIFVEGDKVRFLDLERSFVGDPAFDPAFLFCHYLIETHPTAIGDAMKFIRNFMSGYREVMASKLPKGELDRLENRIIRFLGVTLLYRLFGFYLVIKLDRNKEMWKRIAGRLLNSHEACLTSALEKEVVRTLA